MSTEYEWVHLNWSRIPDVADAWKLVPMGLPNSYGLLLKCVGKWEVTDGFTTRPITSLPRTMPLAEAMNAAKLILLSLKQTGSEE